MTNGKCACTWNDGEVTGFCGAHQEHHRKITEPLLQDKAMLEHIKIYAKNEHPILSSRACPLCEWDGEVENGMWKGTNRKPCTFHFALHQLYALKIEDKKDIWNDEN